MRPELKKRINDALQQNEFAGIVLLVKENRNVLSHLIRTAYNKDTLLGWRAIKATGMAAKALLERDYAFLRETIRKLLWTLSDESGGIGWSAPEIIGEIVCADPERFQDIIPILAGFYDLEEDVFRPGILYALARIAENRADLVVSQKDLAFRGMSDKDPLVRYFGLILVSGIKERLGEQDLAILKSRLQELAADKAEVWVYKDAQFVNVQLAEAVSGV